jgi:hypothetical protein
MQILILSENQKPSNNALKSDAYSCGMCKILIRPRRLAQALGVKYKNENITNNDPLGNLIGSLLANSNTSLNPMAFSMAIIYTLSYCWNPDGSNIGTCKKHTIFTRKTIGL